MLLPSLFAFDAFDVAFYGFWCSSLLLFGLAPTWVALVRHHPSTRAIVAVNVLLGWTCVGWVWALVWAATSFERPVEREDYNG